MLHGSHAMKADGLTVHLLARDDPYHTADALKLVFHGPVTVDITGAGLDLGLAHLEGTKPCKAT